MPHSGATLKYMDWDGSLGGVRYRAPRVLKSPCSTDTVNWKIQANWKWSWVRARLIVSAWQAGPIPQQAVHPNCQPAGCCYTESNWILLKGDIPSSAKLPLSYNASSMMVFWMVRRWNLWKRWSTTASCTPTMVASSPMNLMQAYRWANQLPSWGPPQFWRPF